MANVYKPTRSQLSIELSESSNLGRCYNSTIYKVISASRLSLTQFQALRAAGFLGFGQEFRILTPHDGNEEPTGFDVIECVDSVTGLFAINPLTNHCYKPIKAPYFEYHIEDRIDSSD